MKTIKLVLAICVVNIFTSCTIEEIEIEPVTSEVSATSDKGDDHGEAGDGDNGV